jgi:uncharacterized protein (TIGR03790 family)
MSGLRTFLVFCSLFLAFFEANAQGPENVLLLINSASPASIEIGTYYAQKRSVPSENIVRLQLPLTESIERADYERLIETPLAAWLTRTFSQDRILYIVLTKGIPLRINGTTGQDGTIASVDSELTLLYRKLTGVPVPPAGRINNPYFLGNSSPTQRTPFTHENYDIFLVSRLDGYTVADVRGLIDKGVSPVSAGVFIVDDRAASPPNAWLKSAADALVESKRQVTYDTTATVVKDAKNVLGYYSWGSNDPAIRERQFNLTFANGALAGMFVSTDGRTMNEPPSDWKIGTWEDATTHFAGSPQSLSGDLIRAGVTGTAGHVAEPFLDATIRPNILFPSYLAGANLIEAFYLSMPFLSWQTVVIGDPLCAPFRSVRIPPDQISKGLDPVTEFPVFYSNRRLQSLAVTAAAASPQPVPAETIKLLLKADARAAKNDPQGMRVALEEATSQDARLAQAQLTLGMLYDQAAEYDKAIERYRRALEAVPANLVALNNLAYVLAIRKGALDEASALAEKAYAVGNRNPNITDTFAWILHLKGDNKRARGLLAEAVQAAPQNAGIRLHYAVVLGALGEKEIAQEQLTRALELDPKLAASPDVERLRVTLR